MKKIIAQIAEVKSGYLFKEGLKSDREGNLSVVQLKDVNDRGVLNSHELQRITSDKIGSENFLAVGDVLLKAKTNHPVSALVREQLSSTIATAHYFVISVKKSDVLPGYLAWYLNQRPAQIYFDRNAGGTRIQVINKQLLSELEVVVPDIGTQEKIAKVYELHQREQDLVDAIKEKKHELILDQLLSAISN